NYVREGLERGKKITGAQYAKAMAALWEFKARMEDFFETYDLLLGPTMAVPAFPVGQPPSKIGGRDVDPQWGYSAFTATFNITGNPAASVPCGFSSDGLPIGLHVIGRWGDEVTVLRPSAALERAKPWADKRPALASI
ncbi:MAG: amidase family protein, partial [Dehalococcoidia bacterium]